MSSKFSSSVRNRRNIRVKHQNNHYKNHHQPFVIPASYYNVVHVHRFTNIDVLSTLITHFESCHQYSIDTESDRFTYELSLIQVQSIPQCLPSFVVLFELHHFPSSDSPLFEKIKTLFCVLFRLGNVIFSWGSMLNELTPIVNMRLFSWPVNAELIDLQVAFPGWYRLALPLCEACSQKQLPRAISNLKPSCNCSDHFPYSDPSNKWSLQNALLYSAERFLDKSSTMKNWSLLLDPLYSSLSSTEQQERIRYASYDCIAVTYLHKAILNNWSLIQLRQAALSSLYTTTDLCPVPSRLTRDAPQHSTTAKPAPSASSVRINPAILPSMLLEDVSDDDDDDEIFLSQISTHHNTKLLSDSQLTNTHDSVAAPVVVESVSSSLEPTYTQALIPRRRACRSVASRQRRNRKRNLRSRSQLDRHVIYRKVYHRFTLRLIKQLLRDLNVRYVDLLLDRSTQTLSIGMKKEALVEHYFDRLPGDLFNEQQYRQYRRRGNRRDQISHHKR